MTVTLPRPDCVNILWTILSGLHLAEYVTKSNIFEFVLLLHMQLSYLKMNLKSWSAKYRPYCFCLDVLTRCGRDKVTSILKTTFSISFLTSGEIWIIYKNLHTWNGSHVSAAMLWVRDKMVPLSRWYIQINFPVWNCFIIFFFQIWHKCISKFPYRNLLYHLNILLWEGIKRRAQNMTSLIWKRFP